MDPRSGEWRLETVSYRERHTSPQPLSRSPMNLGIFGGSFDPVHNGHLALARACQAAAALDEVWFTPTAVQPLKRNGPHATDAQRVEMLRLAIQSELQQRDSRQPTARLECCTLEIDRGGFSYSVDTIRQLHEELPGARLFFLIGADAVRDVPRWREPAEIFRHAKPLVVRRAGQPEPDLRTLAELCPPKNQPQLVEMPSVDVSSTDVRRRVANGEPIDELVPPDVADYIAQNRLYRASE
jgi:nicotinate-nucleotide adenylyltransferase